MQLKLNKTELAGALAALGKLISRTAPVEASRAVEITGFADTLYFRTRNAFEEIEFMMFAEMDEDFPATLVNFEQFRLAVRNCKNKMLKLEVDSGEIERLTAAIFRNRISAAFHELGFSFVTSDLDGYRTGSMNKTLPG